MRGFLKWHKRQTQHYMKKYSLDAYSTMWIAFFKGLVMGMLLILFL